MMCMLGGLLYFLIFIFQEALILKESYSSDGALRTPPTLAVTFGLFQAEFIRRK